MRDFKGMKRQRGRNRNSGGAGGKPQAHNANRAFDSNGPEGIKVRGNAQHVFEKYQQLARDAQTSGDRVLAENYLQHAEHYFRVIRAVTPTRSPADILGRDAVQSGYDIDFEDESGAQAYAEAQAEAEQQGQNGQGQQADGAEGQQGRRDDRGFNNNRDRDQNRNRDDRPRDRDDRPRDRDDRPREDRPRDDRPRDDRPREDRPRDDRGPRQDRFENRRDRERNRDDRGPREDRTPNPAADPQAEPQAAPLPAAAEVDSAPVLRSAEGEVSRAPNFLSGGGPRKVATLTPDAGEEPAPKPKRRRAPKSFEGGEPAPAPAPADADEG